MRKDKLIKEWFGFNVRYWNNLKHRAIIHGHLENSEALPEIMAEAEPIFVLSTGAWARCY